MGPEGAGDGGDRALPWAAIRPATDRFFLQGADFGGGFAIRHGIVGVTPVYVGQ